MPGPNIVPLTFSNLIFMYMLHSICLILAEIISHAVLEQQFQRHLSNTIITERLPVLSNIKILCVIHLKTIILQANKCPQVHAHKSSHLKN